MPTKKNETSIDVSCHPLHGLWRENMHPSPVSRELRGMRIPIGKV